jgi:hypothetical protein
MPDELLRTHWDAPAPSAGFHERVQSAYRREFETVPGWRRWVAATAVVAAGVLLLLALPQKPPASRYQPVSRPRFIVISQGEHP